jgi:site-specific recombinase XerD
MANRTPITTYGRRGRNYVRVLAETVAGARLVRVQWSETPGGRVKTESWPHSKENVRTAKVWAEETAARLAAGNAAPPPDVSVRTLRDAHVAAMVEAWAPTTLRNFTHRWTRFEDFVGRHTAARLVSEQTLDEFRAAMRRAGVATNQRGETVKVVKQVFRWARRRKLIAENPIADYTVKLAKGEKKAEVPEWSPEETGRLLAQLEREGAPRNSRAWRLWAAVLVSATQGPRQKALRHLAWTDVNLSGRTVRHPTAADVVLPPRTCWWNPGYDKMRDERVQPLTRDAVRALRIARVWRAKLGAEAQPWVFFGVQQRTRVALAPWTYQAANQALRELCVRAGVAWKKGRALHGFRKHAAGEVHRVTGSERAAADWIGDKSVTVVRRHYLKKRAEEQRAVAEKLGVSTAAGDANRNESRTAHRERRQAVGEDQS